MVITMKDQHPMKEEHTMERYLLGELSPEEQEAFEERMFTNRDCAEDAAAAVAFIENAKAVFGELAPASNPAPAVVPVSAPAPSLWRMPAFAVPLAASVLLAALVGYQSAILIPGLNREIRDLNQAQSPPTALLKSVRSGTLPVVSIDGDRFCHLQLDFNPETPGTRYFVELQSQSSEVVLTTIIPAAQPDALTNVLIPSSALEAGSYTLILRSTAGPDGNEPGAELARFLFDVQME
jgi:hypothetical protein